MPLPVANSILSRHLEAFLHMLACCTTWQAIVGVDNPTDALATIQFPYADDTVVDPETGQIVRPRAIVNPMDKFAWKPQSGEHPRGNCYVNFELPPNPATKEASDRPAQMMNFLNDVGGVLDELGAICRQDDPLHDGMTFLNSVQFVLQDGPSESDYQNQNDELFLGICFMVIWD